MTREHLIKLLQIAGAALGIPAAAAGTSAAYQSYFSTEGHGAKMATPVRTT
jgi:hypothetical protein